VPGGHGPPAQQHLAPLERRVDLAGGEEGREDGALAGVDVRHVREEPEARRGGGQLQSGRTLDYLDKPNRKMCSLFLSLMDKYGVRLTEFGDSKERLSEV